MSERREMMTDRAEEDAKLTPDRVRFLAAVVGVEMDEARAAGLVAQAEPHFALMRALDRIDPGEAEPAGEFRLAGAHAPRETDDG